MNPERQYLARWKVSLSPKLIQISTALCEFLGYDIPIFIGAIFDEKEKEEIHYLNAQVAFLPPENPWADLKVKRISLSRNNLEDLIHECIHVILKVEFKMWMFGNYIPIKYEEYLCVYYAGYLVGFSDRSAKKKALIYVKQAGYDYFPMRYEKVNDIIKTRILIETSDIYKTFKQICLG